MTEGVFYAGVQEEYNSSLIELIDLLESRNAKRDERTEYLKSVADDYGVDFYTVRCLADMLGENEDYDGLISAIEDFYC